ncbi:hypothetical protein BK658_07015 [Pseudomonas brassicacearum]|uniref:Uncharacterized protein n=2 Tax=Pseudomonas brassicacearum TaxID=930166 RepID=A0A423GXH5_9PSED|nr:hypothetical protein BK658_07015 [Pseudomonas brassicacearum]
MGVYSDAYDNGELPGFIAYVKHANPQAFDKAFGKFGLDTVHQWGEAAMYIGGVRTFNSWIKLSSEADFEELPRTKEGAHYLKTWHWHYRMSMAGRTIDGYRKSMWEMAKLRISKIIEKEVSFRVNDHVINSTLGSVFTSEKAISILLRWHVYRPAHVVTNASRVVPIIQSVIDASPQINWALPVANWGNAHETALTTRLLSTLAELNSTITNAVSYGSALPQGSVRSERNSFALDA